MYTWGITDLETENHEHLGSKASPFCDKNYIVAPAYAFDSNAVTSLYFKDRTEADASDWADVFFSQCNIMVAHNATFEIHWFMHRHKEAFLKFLKRGGRIFCTQYAEYLLSHQTEQYPALNDVAPRYGGTTKIDEVKMLWEQGYLTSQIDKDLLLEYLAGPSGDIENTRLTCFGQYAALVANGMIDMFWHRMDALVFNALSTFNGLFIDLEVAQRNHAEQLARAEELTAYVSKMLPDNMPSELDFNFGSGHHMSAWLFGGPIKYKQKVSYDPIKYEKADFYKSETGVLVLQSDWENYTPEQRVLFEEKHGWLCTYKAGKNKGSLKVFREDTDVEKLKWGDAIYTFPGLIPIVTLPVHVQEQYVGKRAEFRGKQYLCDREVEYSFDGTEVVLKEGTPIYSTGKDSLDLLANFTEVAKPLKELAQLEKDNGTYYITYEYNEDGSVRKSKGMLQFVNEQNIIHHQLNGCSTITSRLSSSNPNLQNLPRDGTSKVKQMFASRFGTDGRIVEVDYTALEVVALAAISNDQNLLNQLLSGTDMHCYRLAPTLGLTYEETLARFQSGDKQIKQQRTDIKPRAFAAQYGASAAGISFATGCTIEDAQAFLENEAKLFPDSIAFRGVVRAEVERTGAAAKLHREMNDAGGFSVYRRGYYQAKGGTCYSFRTYEKRVDGQRVQDYKDTQIANYPIQGEASFVVQCSCGFVIRWLIENDFFGGCVVPVNTVHDAIYLDCVNEEWARWAGKMVAQLMADTPKRMCESMPAYKEWRYHTTPFPAVPEFGINMLDKEHC